MFTVHFSPDYASSVLNRELSNNLHYCTFKMSFHIATVHFQQIHCKSIWRWSLLSMRITAIKSKLFLKELFTQFLQTIERAWKLECIRPIEIFESHWLEAVFVQTMLLRMLWICLRHALVHSIDYTHSACSIVCKFRGCRQHTQHRDTESYKKLIIYIEKK